MNRARTLSANGRPQTHELVKKPLDNSVFHAPAVPAGDPV
jgi:hypothetical protein